MCPVLFHIYGPFSINAYGVAIALGLILFLYLSLKDKRLNHLMTEDQAISLFSTNIILCLIGGRVLHVLSDSAQYQSIYDFIAVWDGGFSLLGTLATLAIFNPLYLFMKKIPILPALDIAGTFIPLVQACGRIGCFLAGCCYGLATALPWGITYRDPLAIAPLGIPLHPTQLYSAALHIVAFFLLKYFGTKTVPPGTIFALYLLFASTIRFGVDFLRDDRTKFIYCDAISLEQFLALILCVVALVMLSILFIRPQAQSS